MRGLHAAPPSGDWLCWPCYEYEREKRLAGVPQSDIRPQRWELAARGITHAQLEGGSNTAQCALCPVKFGAFKRTVGGKDWCHLVGDSGAGFVCGRAGVEGRVQRRVGAGAVEEEGGACCLPLFMS